VRERPDLYRGIGAVFSHVEAIELELNTASYLRQHGYSVRSN
jgi:hypothetical protein